MGTIFSPSEALRTWDTDSLPILLLSFFPFPLFPCHPLPAPVASFHSIFTPRATGPARSKLPGSPRWPPSRRSPVRSAHEPAALTSREGGRMERQPHVPVPQHVLLFWVCEEPQPDPFAQRRRLSLASQARQDGVAAAAATCEMVGDRGLPHIYWYVENAAGRHCVSGMYCRAVSRT